MLEFGPLLFIFGSRARLFLVQRPALLGIFTDVFLRLYTLVRNCSSAYGLIAVLVFILELNFTIKSYVAEGHIDFIVKLSD